MGKPYTLDADRDLVIPIRRNIRATDLSRESSEDCGIACEYRDYLEGLLPGESVKVTVLRTTLHVRIGGGPAIRYAAGRAALRGIRRFDDPDDGIFPAGIVTYHPPRDRDPETGKVQGSGKHGKDATDPTRKVVSQNHNRRTSKP